MVDDVGVEEEAEAGRVEAEEEANVEAEWGRTTTGMRTRMLEGRM